MQLENSLLGKKAEYKNQYDNSLLFAIPRSSKREEIGIKSLNSLPFYGVDIWNCYEFSWLNNKGKPHVAIITLYVPADSEFIFESKSLKLYLNSFNNSKFGSQEEVSEIIKNDLSNITKADVRIELNDLSKISGSIDIMPGKNIDSLDVTCLEYDTVNPDLLEFEDHIVSEELSSDLLKSNCLITNQPDWASVGIKYKGKKLKPESILRYIVSFRDHNEFHEQCVERIFYDIKQKINPEYLSVYARYTRRGGIDICPYRTTDPNFTVPDNMRLARQ